MKESKNDFFERLKKEFNLVKSCETNLGFFQRIVERFIPFLRSESCVNDILKKMEKELTDESGVLQANEELVIAFSELWGVAKNTNDKFLKRELIAILRKVRGPARFVKLGATLIRRIYPYLERLYKAKISHEAETVFAQAALKLFQMDGDEKRFQANAECSPRYLWLELLVLESCWPIKNKNVLQFRWKRLYGDLKTVGIRSNELYNQWLLQGVAEELRVVDKPGYSLQYFRRSKFEFILTRFVDELGLINQDLQVFLELKDPEKDLQTRNDNLKEVHSKTRRYHEDLLNLKEVMDLLWKNHPSWSREEIIEEAKTMVKYEIKSFSLNCETDALYKTAARETDPNREEKQKKFTPKVLS